MTSAPGADPVLTAAREPRHRLSPQNHRRGARPCVSNSRRSPTQRFPGAVEPAFQHAVTTYAGEANKTVSVWHAVPDGLLDFRPPERTNTIRTILVHQLLSERRFFAQFVGTEEPPVEELLPPGDKPAAREYIEKYTWLAKRRLPQLARGSVASWLEAARSSAASSASGSGASGGG